MKREVVAMDAGKRRAADVAEPWLGLRCRKKQKQIFEKSRALHLDQVLVEVVASNAQERRDRCSKNRGKERMILPSDCRAA